MVEYRGFLGKRKGQLTLQSENQTRVVKDGRENDLILGKLDELSVEMREVERKIAETEREIQRQTLRRPTAAAIQDEWGKLMELWGHATEAILQSVVSKVTVQEKNSVSLELRPVPGDPELIVRNKKQTGSGGWI